MAVCGVAEYSLGQWDFGKAGYEFALTGGVCEEKINPNKRTISIEDEGDSYDVMPDAQYQATLALHLFLTVTAGIKPEQEHIIGHYQITGKHRANCLGPVFRWERFMRDLAEPQVKEPVPGLSFQDPVTSFFVVVPLASFGVKMAGWRCSADRSAE